MTNKVENQSEEIVVDALATPIEKHRWKLLLERHSRIKTECGSGCASLECSSHSWPATKPSTLRIRDLIFFCCCCNQPRRESSSITVVFSHF